LGTFLSRDVAAHGRGADRRAVAAGNRRCGHGHVETAAVLADANGLELVHALSRPRVGEDSRELVFTLGGYQHANAAPEHLVAGVAVHPFGPAIPREHEAVEIVGDD